MRKLSPETSEQGRSHEAPNSEVARPRLPVVLSEEASPHARRLSVAFSSSTRCVLAGSLNSRSPWNSVLWEL